MKKELNLIKILEKAPKGTKLYSTIDGEVTLIKVRCSNFPILATDKFGNNHAYTIEGKYEIQVQENVFFFLQKSVEIGVTLVQICLKVLL